MSPSDSSFEIVPFHGDMLQATKDERGVWVPLRPMCDALSIATQRQLSKVKSKAWATITMKVTIGEDGRARAMACLHLDSLPMWLATIETTKVRPEARAKLTQYQVEAARVLASHFLRKTHAEVDHASHGARIGDTTEGRETVLRAWRYASVGGRLSMQRVGGFVRKTGNAASPYRVALCDWPIIERQLHEIAMGRLPLAPRQLRASPVSKKQESLRFGAN